MELGTVIAITILVILGILVGICGGAYLVIIYLTSPKGFVRDLTDPHRDKTKD